MYCQKSSYQYTNLLHLCSRHFDVPLKNLLQNNHNHTSSYQYPIHLHTQQSLTFDSKLSVVQVVCIRKINNNVNKTNIQETFDSHLSSPDHQSSRYLTWTALTNTPPTHYTTLFKDLTLIFTSILTL